MDITNHTVQVILMGGSIDVIDVGHKFGIRGYIMGENKYFQINEWSKQHLEILIKWLVAEVCSASGDGDSLWYSKYYDIVDIYNLIEELQAQGKFDYPNGWKLDWELELKNGTIVWGKDQEALVITNDRESFLNSPDWYQCKIQY